MTGWQDGRRGEGQDAHVIVGWAGDQAQIGVRDRDIAGLGFLRVSRAALTAVGEDPEAFDDAGIAAAHAFGGAETEAHVAGTDDGEGGAEAEVGGSLRRAATILAAIVSSRATWTSKTGRCFVGSRAMCFASSRLSRRS